MMRGHRLALRAFGGLLACALLALALRPSAAAPPQPAGERVFRIYLIQWRGPTETDRGFMEYFAQEGIRAEFIVRDANRDPNAIPGFVEEINRVKPDLVYTWGGAAPPLVVGRYDRVDARKHVVDIPVVACMVADPVELGVVPSWESSGRNVTGTSHVAPVDVQVRAMQAYGPLKHLAAIYNVTEPGPGVVVTKLKQLAETHGFRFTAWPVPVDADGKPRVDALPDLVAKVAASKPDFLYLGPDSFLGANRQVVTEAALAAKLPTFVSSEVYLKEAEALAGIVSGYYNLGQFCAYKAERILVHGVRPQDIPFETLKRFSYMIRREAAREVDHYPPINLLNMAEMLRD